MRWQKCIEGDPGGARIVTGYADGKIRHQQKVLCAPRRVKPCFMSDEDVAARAKETGSTARGSLHGKAAELDKS